MTDAVVLAGGQIPESEAAFRDAVGVPCKRLISVAGRMLVGHVVAALAGAEQIDRIVVVGPAQCREQAELAGAYAVVPEGDGRWENLALGLAALPDADRVLMATSDIRLATAAMYDDLLAHFGAEVDLGYTLVRHETVLADFGDRPPPPPEPDGTQMPNWVTVAIRDGCFTGTPCMLVRRSQAERLGRVLKPIFDNREMGNVVRVLRGILGLTMLARIALAFRMPALRGLVSIAALEQRMSRGLGMTCRAYVSPFSGLAFDVDHASDLAIVEEVLTAASGDQPG